jgi:hypothetical protein
VLVEKLGQERRDTDLIGVVGLCGAEVALAANLRSTRPRSGAGEAGRSDHAAGPQLRPNGFRIGENVDEQRELTNGYGSVSTCSGKPDFARGTRGTVDG